MVGLKVRSTDADKFSLGENSATSHSNPTPLLAHFYGVDLLQVRGENRLATVTVSRSRRSGVIEPSE